MPIDPILTATIIPFVAGQIYEQYNKKYISPGLKKLLFKPEEYSIQLNQVIRDTIEKYEKSFPPNGKYPFYHHKETFANLSNFILFENDNNNILNEIDFASITEIDQPTTEEINHFYETFIQNVQADSKLKSLYIEENYKEKIFDIHKEITSIKFIIEQFINKLPSTDGLVKNWLEQIFDNLKSLKSKTALDEINKFESDILPSNNIGDRNRAFMYFVKGLCLNEERKGMEAVEYFKEAHNLEPTNSLYKTWYLYISYIFQKTPDLILEIKSHLSKNVFDPSLNAIVHFMDCSPIPVAVPNEIPLGVRNTLRFKRLVYRHYLLNHKVDYAIGFFMNDDEDVEKLLSATTLDNYGYLDFYLQLFFIKLYQDYPENNFLQINKELRESLQLTKGIGLFEKYAQHLRNSEKHELYDLHSYLLNILYYLKEGGLKYLNAAHVCLKRNKDIFSPFYLGLLRSGFAQEGDFATALELYESTEIEPIEYYFKSYIQERLGNSTGAIDSLKEIFNKVMKIDDSNAPIVIDAILHPEIKLDDLHVFYQKVSTNEISTEGIYRDLIIATKGTKDKSQEQSCIEILANNYQQIVSDPVRVPLLTTYCRLLQLYSLWPYIVQIFENKEPQSYLLKCVLIEAHYFSKINPNKLISILEELRTNKSWQLLEKHLIWEIELNSLLEHWEKIATIAELGLKLFQNNYAFSYYQVLAAANTGKKNEYPLLVKKLEINRFKLENLKAIVKGFIHLELFPNAIECAFNYVRATNDPLAKGFFFQLFYELSELINFSVPLNCEKDYFVVLDNGTKKITINEKEHQTIFTKVEGKKVGDAIMAENKLSNSELKYIIVGIKHKYELLIEEIRHEAESAELTGLPVYAFQMKENATFEEITQQFIEMFGKAGDQRNIFIDKNIDAYKKGQLSIFQLVRAIFNDDVLEGYFALKRSPNVGIRTVMHPVFQNVSLTSSSVLCLDLLSLITMFDASKCLHLTFDRKFVVSSHSFEYLKELLNIREKGKKSEMSLQITTQGVVRNDRDPVLENSKTDFLKELISWIAVNCDVRTSKDKLNFLVHNKGEPESINSFMCSFVDSACLAVELQGILISDDRTFLGILRQTQQFVSSEYFLRTIVDHEILFGFLSERSFIGIEIPLNGLREKATAIIESSGQYLNLLQNFKIKNGICSQNVIVLVAIVATTLGAEIDENKREEVISTLFSQLFFDIFQDKDLLQQIVTLVNISIFRFLNFERSKIDVVQAILFRILEENNVNVNFRK